MENELQQPIEFRAWDNKDKKWLNTDSFFIMGDNTFGSYASDDDVGGLAHPSDTYFMQYTGLKDKNGLKIYCGDILKYAQYAFGNTVYDIGAVENSNGLLLVGGKTLAGKCTKVSLCCYSDSGKQGCLGLNNTGDVEIIGNVYENKDLLTN